MGGAHWRPVSVASLILGRTRSRMPRHSRFAGAAAALFLACGGAAALASDPPSTSPCRWWASRNTGGLQALRLGESECAEGRHASAVRRRLFRQPQPVHLQGPEGRRSRAALRFADGRQPGRGLDAVLPDLRVGVLSGRLLVGHLQAAAPRPASRMAARSRSRTSSIRCRRRRRPTRSRSTTTRTSSRPRSPVIARSPSHSIRKATASCR